MLIKFCDEKVNISYLADIIAAWTDGHRASSCGRRAAVKIGTVLGGCLTTTDRD